MNYINPTTLKFRLIRCFANQLSRYFNRNNSQNNLQSYFKNTNYNHTWQSK